MKRPKIPYLLVWYIKSRLLFFPCHGEGELRREIARQKRFNVSEGVRGWQYEIRLDKRLINGKQNG